MTNVHQFDPHEPDAIVRMEIAVRKLAEAATHLARAYDQSPSGRLVEAIGEIHGAKHAVKKLIEKARGGTNA